MRRATNECATALEAPTQTTTMGTPVSTSARTPTCAEGKDMVTVPHLNRRAMLDDLRDYLSGRRAPIPATDVRSDDGAPSVLFHRLYARWQRYKVTISGSVALVTLFVYTIIHRGGIR